MSPLRVLIVAYQFPPLGGGGVQRSVKFVKYLPESGWEPTVLTTAARLYHAEDETLAADLPPGLRVLRAPELMLGRRVAGRARRAGVPYAPYLAGWPDREAGWIPGAVRAGVRAVRELQPHALYSSAPPASTHMAALAIHRLTGVPWVADFRDPWANYAFHNGRPPGFAAADRTAERTVTRHARQVVVSAEFARIEGTEPGDPKRTFIPNGVDPDDVPDDLPGPDGARFRLAFVGSLYRSIDCAPILAALRRLAERGVIHPGELEFRVVGNVGVPDLDAGSLDVVRTGYVNHSRAVREMAAADALVCYVPSAAPQNTPGKIYEYLATGRPVLCVTAAANYAYRLVDELGAGACAEPHEHHRIEAAIEDMFLRWKAGPLAPTGARGPVLARFSRPGLTRRLAAVLDSAAAAAAPLSAAGGR